MKRIHRAAGCLLTIAAFSACAGERATEPTQEATADTPRRRIVVMAPAAAEMVEALGARDQIVGIGDFVTEPEAIAHLPRVGAYNAPNIETVLEMRAEAFLTTESQAAAPAHRRLEALGVEVVALDTSTYEGVFDSLAQVGALLDRERRAQELERQLREVVDEIRRVARGVEPRRVLFVVGRDPLYIAGPGSHVDEMIELVGGTNVFHDAGAPYLRVSTEAVLERMPEVIVDTSDNDASAPRGRVTGAWGRWEFLPAVEHGRVYMVEPSRLVIPGLRLPEMTRLMGRLIQPERFGEATTEELGGG